MLLFPNPAPAPQPYPGHDAPCTSAAIALTLFAPQPQRPSTLSRYAFCHPAQVDGSLHGLTPPSARRRRQRETAIGAAAAHIDIDVPAREPLLLSWEDICCTVPAPASPGGARRILQVPAPTALVDWVHKFYSPSYL